MLSRSRIHSPCVVARLKEIIVASGKGGVGKTTVTACLAVFLAKKGYRLVAVDADVDAPNLSIVLGGGDRKSSQEIKISRKAVINTEKCVKCGQCIEACQFGAIMQTNDNYPLMLPILCEGCGACSVICPENAIKLEEKMTGELQIEESKYGFPVVTGRLMLGEHNSGNLVTAAKKFGHIEAENIGADIVLVDGAPGIGCPVIASITGANYVIAVTEPTPAATRDLQRLITVASHFKVPSGVVINKADISVEHKEKLEKWVKIDLYLPILGEIPLDYEVLKALANMTPITEFNPKSKASKAILSFSETFVKTQLHL